MRRSRLRAALAGVCVGAAAAAAAGCGDGAAGRGAPAEAADSTLQRMAAELLPTVETLAGLPARAPLALARRNRAELERYLEEELAEQLPPERARSLVRVYARLGLVPDTLEIGPLLQSLLLEQVVGYYDPRRDTLYVVEGVDPDLLQAVLAHEMVHALQDQYQDLDSLTTANEDRNDVATAAQAALEGHATLVMVEWQLRSLLGPDASVEDLPELDSVLEGDPLALAGMQFPALENAPVIIREGLLFPYLGGLRFARAVRRSAGEATAPLGPLLPRSTEQVLHPERLLSDPPDEPTPLRYTGAEPGWGEIRADALGEEEIRILLRELLGDRARAERAAEGWDGDRYRLLESPAGETLVWASVWDGERDASEFAEAIADAMRRRPGVTDGRLTEARRLTISGRPGVLLVDRPVSAGRVPESLLAVEADGP